MLGHDFGHQKSEAVGVDFARDGRGDDVALLSQHVLAPPVLLVDGQPRVADLDVLLQLHRSKVAHEYVRLLPPDKR